MSPQSWVFQSALATLHAFALVIAAALAIGVFPGVLELLIVTAGSLLPSRKARHVLREPLGKGRLSVLIPAHNETLLIERCLASLAAAAAHACRSVEIVVVADNCTDDTARKARAAGARVLERSDAELQGKGYALQFAFERILAEGSSAVLIIDADSEVSVNCIEACEELLDAGAGAVQLRYLARNGVSSLRTRLLEVALLAFNHVRPLGRSRLGLSCGIFGNGFAISAACMARIPYRAFSLVEDLEYHLRLVMAGVEVEFLSTATVWADLPVGDRAASSQRSRWEGGRLGVARQYAPAIALRVFRGDWRCFEPLLELLCLPLAFHGAALAMLSALCGFGRLPFRLSLFCAAADALLLLHIARAISASPSPWLACQAFLAAPGYLFWKLSIIRRVVAHAAPNSKWVRTEREAS